MDTLAFLRSVWPSEGFYCIAAYVRRPEGPGYWKHLVLSSIEEAAEQALMIRARTDAYLCMNTLAERRVFNPMKKPFGWKDGDKLGAYETRTHANMKMAKCFFMDLDVGESTERNIKYESQAAAIAALRTFIQKTGLPYPTITSSGRGVHVFWPLVSGIPTLEWKRWATKLKSLSAAHRLYPDKTRVDDQSSVLRVPGTFHLKDPANPKPVVILKAGVATPNDEFLALLEAACDAARVPEPPPTANGLFDSNLGGALFDGAPVAWSAVLEQCAVMRWVRDNPEKCDEPMWYAALGVSAFCEDGETVSHDLSKGHPDYAADATTTKIQQVRDRQTGATSCARLSTEFGADLCKGCSLEGQRCSPLKAASKRDLAPPPVVTDPVTQAPVVLCQPPHPWSRRRGKGIQKTIKDPDDDELSITVSVYPYDLYPVQTVANDVARKRSVVFHTEMPFRDTVEFTIDISEIYDPKSMTAVLAGVGLVVPFERLKDMRDYMLAYIAELKRHAAEKQQYAHLGWTEDFETFILPETALTTKGPQTINLTENAKTASETIRRAGTLGKQIRLMDFYDEPEYQFFVATGLAAPIFYMTGHHGLIMNASGPPGASKSTALMTAASFWADPESFPINGMNSGATARFRAEHMAVLSNLPICVDEITLMSREDAQELALGVSQKNSRGRLDQKGNERRQAARQKATIMMTTGNNSLHDLIASRNASGSAGSMRVFEIRFREKDPSGKSAADAYFRELKRNYGHIGPTFLKYVMRNQAPLEHRIIETMAELDSIATITPSERFWCAGAAATLVTVEETHKLGLLPYRPEPVRRWLLDAQLPSMRGAISANYASPLDVFNAYIAQISSDILVVRKGTSGRVFEVRKPARVLRARFDLDQRVLSVDYNDLKEYCLTRGVQMGTMHDTLVKSGLGIKRRVTLGKGIPEYTYGPVMAVQVDMKNPAVAGSPALRLVETGAPQTTEDEETADGHGR